VALRQLCWQVAGVERQGSSLGRALTRVRRHRAELEATPLLRAVAGHAPGERLTLEQGGSGREVLLRAQELRQRLVLAELLMEAARFREESRGGHFRTDAPAPQPCWRRHSVQERGRPIHTLAVGGRENGDQNPVGPL
jgi:L-aspartate oxidase